MGRQPNMHYRITLAPQRWYPEYDEILVGGSTIEILSEHAGMEDAIEALEGWAAAFDRLGYIPRTALDWQNESPINVVRRVGRKTFFIRCDTFEIETETGYVNGFGYLRAEQVPN